MSRTLLILAALGLCTSTVSAQSRNRDHRATDRQHLEAKRNRNERAPTHNERRHDDHTTYTKVEQPREPRVAPEQTTTHVRAQTKHTTHQQRQAQRAFRRADRNKDGRVSLREWRTLYDNPKAARRGRTRRLTAGDRTRERFFKRADRNNDGRLSQREWQRQYRARA